MAWGMISGKPSSLLDSRGSSPAVIPLAVPRTAGPGAVPLAFMLAAGPIERVLHVSRLSILSRLFGLILLAIALTSIMSSLRTFFPGWAG